MNNMYDNFTPEEIQELKDQFVQNECETDQYRETQPVSGLYRCMEVLPQSVCDIINKYIGGLFDGMQFDGIEQMMFEIGSASQEPIVLEVLDWISEARFGGYNGSDELYPILEKVFDSYVSRGEHPYGYNEKQCREWIDL